MSFEVSLLISSVKVAYDMAKSILTLKTESEKAEQFINLRDTILSIQNQAMNMAEKHKEILKDNDLLRNKLVELEKWKEIAGEHELKEVAPGLRVQIKKGTNQTVIKKAAWFCPVCFENHKIFPLQREYDLDTSGSYICPGCKFTYQWDEGTGFAHADIAPSIGEY